MAMRYVMAAATALLHTLSCASAYASRSETPSPKALAEGVAFADWLQNVFKLPSLLPAELRRMGVDVRLRESVKALERSMRQTYSVVSGVPSTRDMLVDYEILWGHWSAPGPRLSVRFMGPNAPCVTEEALKARFGDPSERSKVRIIRHGAGGAPPKDERITYRTAAGNLAVSFLFEYSCASDLRILDLRPAAWIPPNDGPALGAIASTAQGRVNVDERVAYWRDQLQRAVPVGSRKEHMLAWFGSKGIQCQADSHGASCAIETLKGDGVVCSAWHILMWARFSPAGRITNYEFTRADQCR